MDGIFKVIQGKLEHFGVLLCKFNKNHPLMKSVSVEIHTMKSCQTLYNHEELRTNFNIFVQNTLFKLKARTLNQMPIHITR